MAARCLAIESESAMKMTVEPQKVSAIRAAVAFRLGINDDEVEAQERRVPGSDEDEPAYLTLLVPRKEGLDDDTINAAVVAVNADLRQHPAYPVQLRWEYKP